MLTAKEEWVVVRAAEAFAMNNVPLRENDTTRGAHKNPVIVGKMLKRQLYMWLFEPKTMHFAAPRRGHFVIAQLDHEDELSVAILLDRVGGDQVVRRTGSSFHLELHFAGHPRSDSRVGFGEPS